MGAFNVDPTDLTTLATSFSGAVPGTARDVGPVAGALGIDTGNAALNARITTLAGQVATSLAGAGQALTADSSNLTLNAGVYAAADLNSNPALGLIGPLSPAILGILNSSAQGS